MARRLLVCGAAVAVLAGASQPAGARDAPLCDQLADVFYIVARYEERGDTKESQLVWVRKRFGADEAASHALDRAVDYVYQTDAKPEAIRKEVRESCSVNDQGQAELRLPGF